MYSQEQEPWSEKPTVCQERCWDFGLLDPREAGGKGHWRWRWQRCSVTLSIPITSDLKEHRWGDEPGSRRYKWAVCTINTHSPLSHTHTCTVPCTHMLKCCHTLTHSLIFTHSVPTSTLYTHTPSCCRSLSLKQAQLGDGRSFNLDQKCQFLN